MGRVVEVDFAINSVYAINRHLLWDVALFYILIDIWSYWLE